MTRSVSPSPDTHGMPVLTPDDVQAKVEEFLRVQGELSELIRTLDDAGRSEVWEAAKQGALEKIVEIRSRNVQLAPIECQPWCCTGDGHPNANHADDQWCASEELVVSLTLRQPDDVDRVTVYAMNFPARETFVAVQRGDEIEARLTPAETFSLIENLQLVLGQIGASR